MSKYIVKEIDLDKVISTEERDDTLYVGVEGLPGNIVLRGKEVMLFKMAFASRQKELKKKGLLPDWKWLKTEVATVETKQDWWRERLIEVVKLAYRKHWLDDESIGWEELGKLLQEALCAVLGDEGYQEWLDSLKEE